MTNCKVIALTSSRQAMLYRHAEVSACLSRSAVSPLKITTAMLGCDFVLAPNRHEATTRSTSGNKNLLDSKYLLCYTEKVCQPNQEA